MKKFEVVIRSEVSIDVTANSEYEAETEALSNLNMVYEDLIGNADVVEVLEYDE